MVDIFDISRRSIFFLRELHKRYVQMLHLESLKWLQSHFDTVYRGLITPTALSLWALLGGRANEHRTLTQ